MRELPPIDDGVFRKYLTGTNILTKNMSIRYKVSRPYAIMQNVHSMRLHTNPLQTTHPTFIILQSRVNASQSASPDDVKVAFVILDKLTGQPYGGYCSCTVG